MERDKGVIFDIVEFLKEYQKYPCLWNKVHPKFKDRVARGDAEERLLAITGVANVNILRRKIRSIRGTYNTEMRKINKSKKIGAATHVPKLSWFQIADRFLRPTTETFSESNINTDEEKEEGEEEEEEYEQKFNIHETRENQPGDGDTNPHVSNINGISMSSVTHTSEPRLERPITKRAFTAKVRRKQRSSISKTVSALANISSSQANNEFTVFGSSVAVQLQRLPLAAALQLQADIQNLITQTRLQHLQESSSTESSRSSSSLRGTPMRYETTYLDHSSNSYPTFKTESQ